LYTRCQRRPSSAFKQTFDFFEQDRQIGPIEADVWRWNAVVLDIGFLVFLSVSRTTLS